jgi:dynein heavy chain, axonemal
MKGSAYAKTFEK